MKLNYRLVTESLDSLDPTANVLKTPIDPKHIVLQDRGDGAVQAVFLEPVRDLRYHVKELLDAFATIILFVGVGFFLTYGAVFVLAALGLVDVGGI